MSREVSSARSGAVFLTVLALVSQALGFAYRAALARMVGPEVMGLYQLVMPVYSVLMSLTAVGLTAAASNLCARLEALGDRRGADQVLYACLRLLVVLLVPLGTGAAVFSDPISAGLLGDARTRLGLVLLVPCVALTGVENIHKHYFYGTGRVRPPALVELVEQFIRAGAVLGLLALLLPLDEERAVGVIVTGMIVCEVFSALALTVLYRRHRRRAGLAGPGLERGELVGRVAAIALPAGLTALLGNLMGAVNAALIPQRLTAAGMDREGAVAAFGVVCGMTLPMLSLPTVFLGPLNLVMVPRLARDSARGRWDRVRAGIGGAVEGAAGLILPALSLLTVAGPALGRLIYGREEAGEHLLPLAGAVACGALHSVLAGALNGIDRPGDAAGIALGCDVVQLAFTAFAMGQPGMGMGGYIAGVLVSSALGMVLCAWAVCRRTGLRLSPGRLVPALLSALAAGQGGLLVWNLLSAAADLPRAAATLLLGGGAALAVRLVFAVVDKKGRA